MFSMGFTEFGQTYMHMLGMLGGPFIGHIMPLHDQQLAFVANQVKHQQPLKDNMPEFGLAVTVHNTGYRRKPFILVDQRYPLNEDNIMHYIRQEFYNKFRSSMIVADFLDKNIRPFIGGGYISVLNKVINPFSNTRKARNGRPVSKAEPYLTVEKVRVYPNTQVSDLRDLAWWLFVTYLSDEWAETMTNRYTADIRRHYASESMEALYAYEYHDEIYRDIRLKLCYLYDAWDNGVDTLRDVFTLRFLRDIDNFHTDELAMLLPEYSDVKVGEKRPELPLDWIPMHIVQTYFKNKECVGKSRLMYQPIMDIVLGIRGNWIILRNVEKARIRKYNEEHKDINSRRRFML